jgi:hypothetical protein
MGLRLFERGCPAGRAPYAGGDHFVVGVSLRLGLPMVGNDIPDHREGLCRCSAKTGIPVTK